jgi:hypothetical protein
MAESSKAPTRMIDLPVTEVTRPTPRGFAGMAGSKGTGKSTK